LLYASYIIFFLALTGSGILLIVHIACIFLPSGVMWKMDIRTQLHPCILDYGFYQPLL